MAHIDELSVDTSKQDLENIIMFLSSAGSTTEMHS